MFATFLFTTLFAFATLSKAISINEPKSFDECDRVPFTVEGNGPLTFSVLNPDDECGTPIKQWQGLKSGATVHLTLAYPNGTQFVFLLEEDNSDNEVWSKVVTVTGGNDTCLTETDPPADPGTNSTAPANSTDPGDDSGTEGAANVGTTSGAIARFMPSITLSSALAALGVALALF